MCLRYVMKVASTFKYI